jgi:hypothetical protein
MIRLYKASSFAFTPFENFVAGDLDFLKENNIEIVNNIKDADIIISQNYKYIKKHFWRGLFGKKFLIWTLEPRFDMNFSNQITVFFGLFKCDIMNVYTRDVFVSNLSIIVQAINKNLAFLPKDYKVKSRKVISLMSYYKGINEPKLMKDGVNIDLIALRSKIALEGSESKIMDVYGKGWPKGISKEDSREGDWVTRKQQLLNNYDFNLCFENTASYNYMTEKIWDSIENYCLPIYYGGNTNIYEIFPENSFIDYAEFDSPKALFDFVNTISDIEFTERMNACIDVYNSISKQGLELAKLERNKMLDSIVKKFTSISQTKA